MKNYLIALTLMLMGLSCLAQAPEAFNYQAVVRDNTGAVLPNQSVSFEMTISQSGTSVYQETHNVTTSDQGLVNFSIGSGTVVSGNFSTINWASGSYELEVGLDVSGGTNYAPLGSSQLISVPYALHANTAATATTAVNVDDADADPTNEIQALSLNNDNLSLSGGGGTVDLSIYTDTLSEVDGDVTNELQTLSLSGSDLSLSLGGGTVSLPGGTGLWQLNGSTAYVDTLLVGVGINNVNSNLFTVSSSTVNPKIVVGTNSFNQDSAGALTFEENINGQSPGLICGYEWIHNGALNRLYLVSGCATPDTILSFTRGQQRLGIGVDVPTANLSVNGIAEKTGGGTWATLSDARVKRDVVDFSDGLDELMKIRPVKFKYIPRYAAKEDPNKEYVGVIAQEIQQVAPYMVEQVDQFGPEEENPLDGGPQGRKEQPELLRYDGSAMSYILVNAVQEQQSQIEKQQQEIQDLQRQNAELQKSLLEIREMLRDLKK